MEKIEIENTTCLFCGKSEIQEGEHLPTATFSVFCESCGIGVHGIKEEEYANADILQKLKACKRDVEELLLRSENCSACAYCSTARCPCMSERGICVPKWRGIVPENSAQKSNLEAKNNFETRAHLQDTECPVKLSECFRCNDPLVFAMRDKNHEFSLGLFSVLECLKLAEKEGVVPTIDEDWWIKIMNHYGQ